MTNAVEDFLAVGSNDRPRIPLLPPKSAYKVTEAEDPGAADRYARDAAWEASRDRHDKPLVRTPEGNDEGYRRASSYGGPLESTEFLDAWKLRKVAEGFALDRGPLKLAYSRQMARLDDAEAAGAEKEASAAKKEMDELCQKAMDLAGAHDKADIGTAIHDICERFDRGISVGHVPDEWWSTVEAWQRLIADFEVLSIERIVVNHEFKVGGKLDRVCRTRRPFVVRKAKRRYTNAKTNTVRPAQLPIILPAGTVIVVDQKGLALTTPLPTPDGWTTMGEVQAGDQVLGSDGRPCTVTTKSQTKRIGTYIVTFDDGSKVTCDSEHIWWVSGGGHGKPHKQVRPVGIEEIRANLRSNQGQAWWRVPVAEPLELPERELPIDPYLLGCWLGDGTVSGGCITKDDELFSILEADGHELGKRQADRRSAAITRTVLDLRTKLRETGQLGHRSIPLDYLRASRKQRMRLLQGLMDTDGSWNIKRHRAVFATTDKALAVQVEELVASLGQRPQTSSQKQSGFGKTVTAHYIEFTPFELIPFRLPRKLAKYKADLSAGRITSTRASRRVIMSVEPGPDVETACIAVDSPNHVYLCGERMIPTHNTSGSMDFAAAKFGCQGRIYATATPYNPITKEDEEWGHEPPSPDWAAVLHTPSGTGEGSIHWIDLRQAGGAMVDADTCYKWRNRWGRQLIDHVEPETERDILVGHFVELAQAADSVDELLELHRQAKIADCWSDDLAATFTARKQQVAA